MLQLQDAGSRVVVDTEQPAIVALGAAEYLIDVAYEVWLGAAEECARAWRSWQSCPPRSGRDAHAAFAATIDREEAAAQVLASACAVAERHRA